MTHNRGKFIVLEGTDGSGTTSQCRLLAEYFGRVGMPCVETREPSTGPVGTLLRAALEKRLESRPNGLDWATFALLFAADRLDHVANEIEPALAAGRWVISDRYTLSSLIYQSVTAPEPDGALSWVSELNRQACKPDLVLVLDVSAAVAETRRLARGGREEFFERRELQAKLAAAYVEAERFTTEPIVHINGELPLSEVAAAIICAIESRLSYSPHTEGTAAEPHSCP